MKNSMILTLGILILSTLGLVAQDLSRTDVPTAILDNFEQNFSNARDVEWEKEGEFYKVDFDRKRNDMEVWYNAGGEIVRQEEEWRKSKLPDAVTNAIKSDYPDYKIEDVTKITEDDKVQFKLDLDASRQEDLDVWIGEDGMILRSERD